jgi:uncharacterized protein (TIGR02996 family)
VADDRNSMIKACVLAPDDDLPKLVFADWLEERGEEDYAQFIRHQVELHRLPKDPPTVWTPDLEIEDVVSDAFNLSDPPQPLYRLYEPPSRWMWVTARDLAVGQVYTVVHYYSRSNPTRSEKIELFGLFEGERREFIRDVGSIGFRTTRLFVPQSRLRVVPDPIDAETRKRKEEVEVAIRAFTDWTSNVQRYKVELKTIFRSKLAWLTTFPYVSWYDCGRIVLVDECEFPPVWESDIQVGDYIRRDYFSNGLWIRETEPSRAQAVVVATADSEGKIQIRMI